MCLNSQTKNNLKKLKKMDLNDIIEIPYSYLEHIHQEYISGSYNCNVNMYIANKQKETLNKLHMKNENDFLIISKNDWIYFLYSQKYDS